VWTDGDEREVASASPVKDLAEEEWRYHQTPSSPLLTAVREAVDSINQYEDFEVLEKIGAGFFAEVFKVSMTWVRGQLFRQWSWVLLICLLCTYDSAISDIHCPLFLCLLLYMEKLRVCRVSNMDHLSLLHVCNGGNAQLNSLTYIIILRVYHTEHMRCFICKSSVCKPPFTF
jgi:hypothetical protein